MLLNAALVMNRLPYNENWSDELPHFWQFHQLIIKKAEAPQTSRCLRLRSGGQKERVREHECEFYTSDSAHTHLPLAF